MNQGTAIHPLAEIVFRRIVELEKQPRVATDYLFVHLGDVLDRSQPQAVLEAGESLLTVARYLRERKRDDLADRLAACIDRSALRATARNGGTALFASATELAGELFKRFSRSEPVHPSTVPPSEPTLRTPSVLEKAWERMDDERRQRLEQIANAYLNNEPLSDSASGYAGESPRIGKWIRSRRQP